MAPVSAIVINLDARRDRWAYMQKTAKRLDIVLERLPAVNGAGLDLSSVPLTPLVRSTLKTGKKYSIVHLESRGAVGAFLSHQLVWKCAAMASEPTFVLEDDARPTEHAKSLVHKAWKQVQDGEWDIVLLGSHDGGLDHIRHLPSWLETSKLKTGSWAYIVSPAAAQALLDASHVMEYQVDIFLHTVGKRIGYANAFQQASFFRKPDIAHVALEPVSKKGFVYAAVLGAFGMAFLIWVLFMSHKRIETFFASGLLHI